MQIEREDVAREIDANVCTKNVRVDTRSIRLDVHSRFLPIVQL